MQLISFLGRSFESFLRPTGGKILCRAMSTGLRPSGTVHFQVYGPCGPDSVPVLFLFTEYTRLQNVTMISSVGYIHESLGDSFYCYVNVRYVFNCSEGTQRLFTECKVKLGKIENIFFTSLAWDHLGGLPGLAMTLRDIGKPRLCTYSPSGMGQILKASSSFLKHEKVVFDSVEISPGENSCLFKDNQLELQPILVEGPKHTAPQQMFPGQLSNDISEQTSHVSPRNALDILCFAGVLPKLPGKFLPKKALELGVPKGPLFGKLQRGITITLPGGIQVRPEDVTEPGDPSPSFALIDCPSVDYISSLADHSGFKSYMTGGDYPLSVMIHLMKTSLYESEAYQAWLKQFPESTFHWIIDKERIGEEAVVLKSQNLLCKQFTEIDNKLFPEIEGWKPQISKIAAKTQDSKVSFGNNQSRFYFRPKQNMGFDDSLVTQLQGLACKTDEVSQGKANTRHDGHVSDPSSLVDSKVSEEIEPLARTNLDNTNPSSVKRLDKEIIENDDCGMGKDCKSHEGRNCFFEEANSGLGDVTVTMRSTLSSTCCGMSDISQGHKRKHNPVSNNLTFSDKEFSSQNDEELEKGITKKFRYRDNEDNGTSVVRNVASTFNDYPRVVFLGTGAALPSKYRNVTCILVRIQEKCDMLFDCGEGSYGQILNHYGNETENVLRNLRCIFISHLHADHHLGLLRILQHHTKLQNLDPTVEPLAVIAPGPLHKWLIGYGQIGASLVFRFINCHRLVSNLKEEFIFDWDMPPGISKVETVEVEHGTVAYGIKITHASGWSMTYSGDTMPSEDLIKLGKDSTFLIHEATLEDELEEEAKEKHHSTISQALNVASKMNAKYTILTHFSQRYPKLPVLNEAVKSSVAIAFDHMEISSQDFPRMSEALPKLIKMFEGAEE